MKWIGQHIWSLISRFRSDVYLENLTESAQDHVVGVDASGKLYKQDVASGDITSVTAGTNCSGGGSSGDVTINVDDAFLINSGDDTTSGVITAGGFTTGTTVITDDSVAMASGIINCSGTAEVAGTTVTLDSGANIELEVGAATNYVNTTGLYRGSNIGVIQDLYIPVLPQDFVAASSYRFYPNMATDGRSMAPSSASTGYIAQKMIPKGYEATHFRINGVDGGSTTAAFIAYENDITGTAAVQATLIFNFNADQAVISGKEIVGDGEKFCTIYFNPGDTTDIIYGGKITIAKTT
tara:strand:+ start:9668 stop:10552 length:885 start_codon:yes stop_codon:yes gene_type:complete